MEVVRESFEVAGGALSLTLSRQIDILSDPNKGQPVPLEASGAHLAGATTLTIAPQATWSFRGGVEAGTPVSIAGHATAYATTAKVSVGFASPGTLSLPITPGLEAPLAGGEVVDLDESSAVSYSGRVASGKEIAARGWSVTAGSAVYLIDYEGKRKPAPGDVVSGDHTGAVLEVSHEPHLYCLTHVGGAA